MQFTRPKIGKNEKFIVDRYLKKKSYFVYHAFKIASFALNMFDFESTLNYD